MERAYWQLSITFIWYCDMSLITDFLKRFSRAAVFANEADNLGQAIHLMEDRAREDAILRQDVAAHDGDDQVVASKDVPSSRGVQGGSNGWVTPVHLVMPVTR
ncbi:MAG TPA: hypothetical protein VFF82_03485 [Rhodocyclaceae bacterium]|nr:hypothetical protein [Rhodocyclaceae bacterium]